MPHDAQADFDATPANEPEGGPDAPGSPSRKTLGPYEIQREIGRGGMGVVFKAYHPGLKRTVALKVLIAGEDASEEAITRFHREAEAVAKLGHHPNIVPVYDIGVEGERHYFAMHFVDGKPLDRWIDDGDVAPKRAASIAKKLADALHHAHQHGVLHRDVKPSNVLMSRVASHESRVTREGGSDSTRDARLEAINLRNVGMVEGSQDLSFSLKSAHSLRVSSERLGQHLDGDFPI